jgi:hypothetical protein
MGVTMMVVMPTFTQGNEGEEPTVAAVIVGIITAAPPNVGEGVDKECSVK